MGVDYSGNFGFGVKVKRNEQEDFIDWLYEKTDENEEIYFFEVGEGSYTGENNDIFVCIHVEDEIEESKSYDVLNQKAEQLYKFLKEINLEYEGIANIVGGLEIY